MREFRNLWIKGNDLENYLQCFLRELKAELVGAAVPMGNWKLSLDIESDMSQLPPKILRVSVRDHRD